MMLSDLATPCLVLDRGILARNLERMAAAVSRHGVALRPHMKTAKSVDVARMAIAAGAQGITVSTLAEAEYFAAAGLSDMIYAVGITPQKLDRVAALNASGAGVMVITDDPEAARAIAAHPVAIRTLVEVDSGEHRGGMAASDERLLAVAGALSDRLGGVLTHAGHSYAGRSDAEMTAIAEAERAAITGAADRLRAAGHRVDIVSMGSSPTARHAAHLDGVTEIRAGVYMFGDLFQAGIGTHGLDDIALTVLSSVVGRRAAEHRFVVDAGGMALSKDRSTQAGPVDYGFGHVLAADGSPAFGHATVLSAYQEHGVVAADPALPFPALAIGDHVRIAPNHTCMTAAAHDRYYVTDGGDEVVAEWGRINGW
jgi:D-serine deaminase-like pyridoxal phosphate-dependent protein